MNEWQPIESAPKDGTRILARQGEWLPHILWWEDGGWKSYLYEHTHHPTLWRRIPIGDRWLS